MSSGSWSSHTMGSPSVASTDSNPILTPQSSSQFTFRILRTPSSSSRSADSTVGSPILTPQFSFRALSQASSSRNPQHENDPIPSIEPSGSGTSERRQTPRPWGRLVPPVDRVPRLPGHRIAGTPSVRSNASNASTSQLTYRGLYNTTPEPRTIPEVSGSGRPVETDRNGIHNSLRALENAQSSITRPATHFRSSSAPVEALTAGPPATTSSYDVNNEAVPNAPYFNADFQRGLRQGKVVAQRISSILGTCELARDRDSQIYSMIETANELGSFAAPSLCTIGIVGDSGVGKSSLINCLLDEANLADTAGLGAACTSVVTEYRSRRPEHTAKYTIEIDRMTDSEIEDLLNELLWSYRFFHITDLDDQNMRIDEQTRLEAQSKLAWDTLQAAFGSHRELTEIYLQDTSSGAEARIKDQLKLWTRALEWPGDSHESGWLGTAETVSECKSKTRQFLMGNLWPFIKIIRIYLSSQVLRSGAILADLPGFHDSNNARVKAADDYMYHCDEVFVVADITRVSTNRNVELIFQKSLGSNLTNGRPSQGVALICTKSEDLDVDEISTNFFSDRTNPDTGRVRLLQEVIEEIDSDPDRPGALRQRDEAQDELNYLFMTARNDFIERLVRRNHAALFNNRRLSIFCVSNKAYKEHRKRSRAHELPILGSGIPALRTHCHKIPAQAQFRIAHHFLTVSLKGLVQRVQLWLAGGSQETMPNDATVQRLLETIQRDLRDNTSNCVIQARESQKNVAKECLIQPMTTNLTTWTQAALEVSYEWSALHHTQIAGFCRNYGSWGSGKVPYTEWNLDLIRYMIDAMAMCWEDHAERAATSMDELKRQILVSLDGLLSQVRDFSGAPLFAEALETKIDSIKHAFDGTEADLNSKLEVIKRDASFNHKSGYIYQIMLPAYRDCCMDSGDGVTARRIKRMREAIGSARSPVLFTAIRSRLQNAVFELIKDILKDLHREINEILRQISSNVEMLRGSEARILAANGDFLDRLEVVLRAVAGDMENIEETAARVKRVAEENQ
ncbi:hypothetical protein DL98DRAFT_658308 [Cadophora sp. DSE1049]|nr:hypothetical protein DL98DRAFT_658308 [Cadophora sp. DSE1049]